MKLCEINKRVENVCNYIIGGIESGDHSRVE